MLPVVGLCILIKEYYSCRNVFHGVMVIECSKKGVLPSIIVFRVN